MFYRGDGSDDIMDVSVDWPQRFITVDDNGVYSFTISDEFATALAGAAGAIYTSVRFGGVLTGVKEDVIITVNEEIV